MSRGFITKHNFLDLLRTSYDVFSASLNTWPKFVGLFVLGYCGWSLDSFERMKHRFIVAKLVGDNIVLHLTCLSMILCWISSLLSEVAALSICGFLEYIIHRWIFVFITLIVVVIMDNYNVERKVLNLATFTPEHTIINRTLLTRIILGRKRIHSISLKTVYWVVVLALIRSLDCVL